MISLDQTAYPRDATRLLAGIVVPDTPIVARAIEYVREHWMKQRFTRDVCRMVESRPGTTYDNFARDFGERFVPGYTRPSTVDFLLNSPFKE